MDRFEVELSIPAEEIEFELRAHQPAPWADFFLNPRRLRGSDFLMRWSQGRWSEDRLVEAVNETGTYFALPYGPSGTAPDDIREHELYFERLEKAGLGELKRPDLLVFAKSNESKVLGIVERLGGMEELPFVPEGDSRMQELLAKSILAAECENSLWIARQMRDYGTKLRPMKRLGNRPGLPKNAVLPTVILKEEDRIPLRRWQDEAPIDIHIWHVFYDLAFGLPFDTAEDLISTGLIDAKEQVFQAPGGATTKKATYRIYYQYAYLLAESREDPRLFADCITDKNGHVLPYVRFEGGALEMAPEALQVLDELSGGGGDR